jgi:spore coat polysaccharide biosynthesis predicted glycosyltransferase SpsG
MRIQIICRGSVKHGLGHLFRTRTFAKVARARYKTEIIAITEPQLEKIFYEFPDEVKYIRTDQECESLVRKFNPDILVFDLTEIDNEVFQSLKKYARLIVSISPIFSHTKEIDLLFTRTSYFEQVPGIKIYGGLEYSIFNEYCKKIPSYEYKKNLKKPRMPIAISMGGTDSPNKTLKIVRSLIHFPQELTLWVALGEGYSHSYNDLVDTIREGYSHEIIMAKASKSTWDILGNSVLAILAGGLTTVEAVYAGLPSINIFDQQKQMDATARELFQLNIAQNGHLFTDSSLKMMVQKINFYYFNRQELLRMRKKTRNLIDNKGSERVLKIIKNHFNSQGK